MEAFISSLNGVIWSSALIYLCLGAGLFYSIQTRFVQVRLFDRPTRIAIGRTLQAAQADH